MEGEREFLRRVYSSLPVLGCTGCYDCAGRCIAELRIVRSEYEAIREYLGGPIFTPTIRDARQMAARCEFADPDGLKCLIYPVRPLICRLFGVVEWLPCPRGRMDVLEPDGPRIMEQYRRFERRSFREWMRQEEVAKYHGNS